MNVYVCMLMVMCMCIIMNIFNVCMYVQDFSSYIMYVCMSE